MYGVTCDWYAQLDTKTIIEASNNISEMLGNM